MTDQSMIERVAKAIYEYDDPWHKAWPWPNLNPEAQGGEGAAGKYRDIARATIEAMREPTMAMLHAAVDRTGAGSDMSWSNRSPQGLFETGWQAMIDAALARSAGE